MAWRNHPFLSQPTLDGGRNKERILAVSFCGNLGIICSGTLSTLTNPGAQWKEDNNLVPERLAYGEEEFRISL